MALTKVPYSMIVGSPFNVMTYGAVGNGIADDTNACQKAIDAAYAAGGGVVVFPGGHTFLMSAVSYPNLWVSSGIPYKASLVLKDNVTLQIDGTLKVKDYAYTPSVALYAVITSEITAGVKNVLITGAGTIDGNKANQISSTSCSNIFLPCVYANAIVEKISSINSNGQGVHVLGGPTTSGPYNIAQNIAVRETNVNNCSYIGIAVAHFNDCRVENNYVEFCADNGIDLNGDDGTSTVNATNFVVTGNTVRNCLNGIFPETVGLGTVTGNTVAYGPVGGSGVCVNSSSALSYGLNITGNTISQVERGVRVINDSKGITINNNTIYGCSVAGVLLGNGGNISNIDVSNNFIQPPNNTTAAISVNAASGVAAYISGRFNTVYVPSGTPNPAYFAPVTAGTQQYVNIGSFRSLPQQIGPDLTAYSPQFPLVSLLYGNQDDIAGPYDISIPDATGGSLYLTAYQGGVGRSTWNIPYTKYSTNLALGTPQKSFITADPIVSVTSVGGAARVTLLAANSYIKWGFTYTSIA